MKTPWLKGIEAYRIIKESPEYNLSMSIYQFESLNHLENAHNSPDWIATSRDRDTSYQQTARGERFWQAAYQLLKSFTYAQTAPPTNKGKGTDDSQIIHLEGYRLAPDEEERFDTWFTRWGYKVYIPLLMKLPGLKQYSQYKHTHVNIPDIDKPKRYVEYPSYLSIITFEDIKAFENYQKSLELQALNGGLRAPFPRGLDYRWYVQYKLLGSWRK